MPQSAMFCVRYSYQYNFSCVFLFRFGTTSSGGSISNVLLEVDVKVDETCGQYDDDDINYDVMLCAGVDEGM